MNTPHVILSKAIREAAEIPEKDCAPMPESCPDLLRWRADIVDDDEDEILALFSNEKTLFSILISETEIESASGLLCIFQARLEAAVAEILGPGAARIGAPCACIGSPKRLIASMNYLRQWIEELRLDRRPCDEINRLPIKTLDWRSPQECFRDVVSAQWG